MKPEVQLYIDRALNLAQAKLYRDASEKYLFVTDILDELDLPRADTLVEYIENCFDEMLEAEYVNANDI